MAEGENKSGPTPELVAAPPSKGVAYPEGMTVVKSGLIQQKIAVSELLAMDQGKRKPAVMTVRTKDPTDSPRKSKKSQKRETDRRKGHMLITKRNHKIDSGVDQSGRYYLLKKEISQSTNSNSVIERAE
jgi:hypothetical protein